jgi:ADP-ribosyl-[dinitrogen reductase] hydrolase
MIDPTNICNMIYGGVVGDCLGVPYELFSREKMIENPCIDMIGHGAHNKPKGTWSDDTSMSLITLDTILTKKKWDIHYFGIECLLWIEGGKYTPDGVTFGTGRTTRESMARFKSGINPYDCGGKEEKNNGNGGLMRIYPLLLLTKGKSLLETLYLVREANRLTHDHHLSHLCCTFYLRFLERLCDNDYNVNDCLFLTMTEFKDLDSPKEFNYMLDDLWHDDIDDSTNIKSAPYVLDTLQASLWCLLNSNSYEECILKGINLGGDTDSTASVVGVLAGCYFKDIPTRWINCIRNKELIDSYINRAIQFKFEME